MKKIIITLFTIFALFGCAEDDIKETYIPEKQYIKIYGEITSELTIKDVSNLYFQENNQLLHCGYFGSGSTEHNQAMIKYTTNLLNDNNSKDKPDAYIDICTGERYSGSGWVNHDYLLEIEINNIVDNTTYRAYYKSPSLKGNEKSLILHTIKLFKDNPTQSHFGYFNIEIE